MLRLRAVALFAAVVAGSQLCSSPVLAGGSAAEEAKEALQPLQQFIGSWKGNGTSEKDKLEIWKESANWGWRFKGKEVFFSAEMPESKFFKNAELRFLPAKESFQMVVIDRKDKKRVFEGKLKKDRLFLEHTDADTKETQQVQINSAGDGDRLILTFFLKPEGRTIFNKVSQIAYTREGATIGAGAKKNECVVTGGLGTMAVSYKGVTYYVCCTGCRDAFNENPEKIIKEYQARKKAGQ
jgi:YHS domain-containing protein